MPLRKDHLQIVTDAGTTLHLGWDYGLPYFLDPINGVDVELQTAQGVHQTGSTVERQSVAGVSRELIVHCWSRSGDADAELLLRSMPYYTAGVLSFGDKWFARFVVQKTPYARQIDPYPVLDMMLFFPKPYWYELAARSFVLGGYTPAFRFPVNYSVPHTFGVRTSTGWLNARNPGALAVPFTATLRSNAAVKNPRILSVLTGAQIGLQTTLEPGDVVEFYRTTTDRLAVSRTRGGVAENIFALLDEDSDLLELPPGDNLLKADADENAENLQVTVSFYPMVTGILPEVLP